MSQPEYDDYEIVVAISVDEAGLTPNEERTRQVAKHLAEQGLFDTLDLTGIQRIVVNIWSWEEWKP